MNTTHYNRREVWRVDRPEKLCDEDRKYLSYALREDVHFHQLGTFVVATEIEIGDLDWNGYECTKMTGDDKPLNEVRIDKK